MKDVLGNTIVDFKVEGISRYFAKLENPETGRCGWASVSNLLIINDLV